MIVRFFTQGCLDSYPEYVECLDFPARELAALKKSALIQ